MASFTTCSRRNILSSLDSTLPRQTTTASRRTFSTSPQTQSNIGGAPLSIPPGVTFDVIPAPTHLGHRAIGRILNNPSVSITGPLGALKFSFPSFVTVDYNASTRKANVSVQDRGERHQREMWGTTRAYLHNHIIGVSEGHSTILRMVGVGYRATIESSASTKSAEYEGQKFVSLKVGYSHPIEMGVPKGVTASTPQPTRILLEGPEKEVVNQFAAKIRKWRVPEPYKGKVSLNCDFDMLQEQALTYARVFSSTTRRSS
jgi:large subunit ribosomal protein L6